jgi:hypothetical protein
MIDEHIEMSAENIPADKKAELLDLLTKLKPSIARVSQTHHDDVQSMARVVECFDPENDSRSEKTGADQETFARTQTIRGKI